MLQQKTANNLFKISASTLRKKQTNLRTVILLGNRYPSETVGIFKIVYHSFDTVHRYVTFNLFVGSIVQIFVTEMCR